MEIKILYRYTRPDGGTTLSLTEPNMPYTPCYRLIAEEGMVLRRGDITTVCIDTDSAEGWEEIPDPDAEPETDEVDDMRAALDILGVTK